MSAAVVALAAPNTASAIPIHKHVTSHRTVLLGDSHLTRTITVEHTIKYDVAPPYVPPAPTVAAQSVSSVAPSVPTQTSVPPAPVGCPASLAGESTSPTAVNASSGASGCIQALPSTWDQYGDPAYAEASDAPVSVQLAAMARICAAQGNDAWVAADPCG
jgi:hypothetical protein